MKTYWLLFAATTALALAGCGQERIEAPENPHPPCDDCIPVPAFAYSCGYTGKSHELLDPGFRHIGLTLCEDHFPPGSDAREAVELMLAHLNGIEGSGVHFYVAGSEPHTGYYETLRCDDVNKLDFVDPDDCEEVDCSFHGRTRTCCNASGFINEFDIAFSDEEVWYFGGPVSWELSDGNLYFRTVLLHELGHGLGFPHVANATHDVSIMGSKTGKWVGNKRTGLKATDAGHIRYHYAAGPEPKPDLILSNYRTRFDYGTATYACVLSEVSDECVSPGDRISFDWTIMNRGGSFVRKHAVAMYLSRDKHISGSDVLLNVQQRTPVGSWPAYDTDYYTTYVTIPSSTPAGTWYLLLVADVYDKVDESRETNNMLVFNKTLEVL